MIIVHSQFLENKKKSCSIVYSTIGRVLYTYIEDIDHNGVVDILGIASAMFYSISSKVKNDIIYTSSKANFALDKHIFREKIENIKIRDRVDSSLEYIKKFQHNEYIGLITYSKDLGKYEITLESLFAQIDMISKPIQ